MCSQGARHNIQVEPHERIERGKSPHNARCHFVEIDLVVCGHQVNGTPKPAARSVAISGPREEQQSAGLPSITTAGTLRMPKCRARSATAGFLISRTVTSQDGQAAFFTSSMVSAQHEQRALKTSILLCFGMFDLLSM